MDVTRKQLTNVEPGEASIGGPMNMFVNIPAFPPRDMKVVVRPNFDTLYSIAWLDLTKEPMIVSVAGYRRALLPAANAGYVDGRVRLAGLAHDRHPGRQFRRRAARLEPARVPSSGAQDTTIDAPTPYVWIIGRTKTDGPEDYDAVHKIQAGYKVTPLSRWGKAPEPVQVKIDPERGHEDAAEDPGRHNAGRQVLRLRGRTPEAASAAHHRSADHRPDEADRNRAGQELRHRQGRSGCQERRSKACRRTLRS